MGEMPETAPWFTWAVARLGSVQESHDTKSGDRVMP
jgi:hypothetical protein